MTTTPHPRIAVITTLEQTGPAAFTTLPDGTTMRATAIEATADPTGFTANLIGETFHPDPGKRITAPLTAPTAPPIFSLSPRIIQAFARTVHTAQNLTHNHPDTTVLALVDTPPHQDDDDTPTPSQVEVSHHPDHNGDPQWSATLITTDGTRHPITADPTTWTDRNTEPPLPEPVTTALATATHRAIQLMTAERGAQPLPTHQYRIPTNQVPPTTLNPDQDVTLWEVHPRARLAATGRLRPIHKDGAPTRFAFEGSLPMSQLRVTISPDEDGDGHILRLLGATGETLLRLEGITGITVLQAQGGDAR